MTTRAPTRSGARNAKFRSPSRPSRASSSCSSSSGVRLFTWSIPAELLEPHSGEPISHDDLLDFHALMESDWMGQLERMTRP